MKAKKIVLKTKEEWLKMKSTRYGGTDASVIFELNPYKSPYDLWLEKKGLAEKKEPSMKMKVGSVFEDGIAKLWAEETESEIIKKKEFTYYLHPEYPEIIGVTPDRIVRLKDGTKAILEVKKTSWSYDQDTYPDTWLMQIQMYMGVLGIHNGIIVWLETGKYDDVMKYHAVSFDKQMYEALVKEILTFHNEYIVKNVEPPLTNTSDVIKKYPFSSGRKMIAQDYKEAEFEQMYSEMVGLVGKIKPLENRLEQLKEKVKLTMLDAEAVLSYDKPIFTFKSSPDKEVFDETAFLKDHPEYFDMYKKLKRGSRRFLIKTD